MQAKIIQPDIAKERRKMLLEMASHSPNRLHESEKTKTKGHNLSKAVALTSVSVLIVTNFVGPQS
jgi:hypothetical protein